ncbi:peroxiredoxin [Sphingomonas parapaucimobilis]|uniref:peroxiredoxin n=1 Tax=Sphingomonas parapaucimobilis TaxID=28213 RepID=UPI0035C7DE89
MQQGDAVPAVTVTTANDEKLALGDLAGPLVVYFYPKDDTSGCTREAQDFTALAGDFESAGVRVIGISKDSPAMHRKFSEKYTLAVELVSDEDGAACEAFGVWGEKKLYGKTYMGIERATFLFGRDGTLVQSWRKVKVPGHTEAVLEAARAL